jgi:hypothetical protein
LDITDFPNYEIVYEDKWCLKLEIF